MKNLKIVLLININLFLVGCHTYRPQNMTGLVIYELSAETDNSKVYSVNKTIIINDSVYRFLELSNKIKKSPFDYELNDSIYNLNLSSQFNLKKISEYVFTLGNDNLYKKKDNINNQLFLCINIKMKYDYYNNEDIDINKFNQFNRPINRKKIIVLDSLISFRKITKVQLKKYNLIKSNISNANIHFLTSPAGQPQDNYGFTK